MFCTGNKKGCVPRKWKDYDVIDLSPMRNCDSNVRRHQLLENYDDARQRQSGLNAEYQILSNTPPVHEPVFDPTTLVRPIHVMSSSTASRLFQDVIDSKKSRKNTHFSNYLAQMGTTGSYQWPNKYIMPTASSSADFKDPELLPNYYNTRKTHRFKPTYDTLWHSEPVNNQYGYLYRQHREDRKHPRSRYLHVNAEELSRKPPGILVNSDYGRRINQTYQDERNHRVAHHKTFFRNRGEDGAK